MQKIRNKFHQPLSLTRFVVGSGIALFLAGLFLLQGSTAATNTSTARLSFIWAGWVLTAGWVLKRAEDQQWPFSPRSPWLRTASRRLRRNLACVFALLLGTLLWCSYGPLMREPMPVTLPSQEQVQEHEHEQVQDASPVLFRSQAFSPGPGTTLSLTNTPRTWTFNPIAAQNESFRGHLPRFGFSSQVMVVPPPLSGRLPSSWDIQP